MFEKCIWVVIFTTAMSAHGESTSESTKNPSLLRSLSNPSSPRAQWTYRPQEDYNRLAAEGISHGSTESSDETGSYWYSNRYNYTNPNYYDYLKPSYGYTGSAGYLYKNPSEKVHSKYQYQLKRPPTSYTAVKKYPVYYKDKHQVLSFDAAGKPRVTKPKIKYPTQTHPSYKRYYYQSPYQRYSIPMSDILRYKYINSSGSYYKGSNQDPGRRYTTERMDDAYPDGTAAWEDYSTYNDTSSNTGANYYEETYEEEEKSASDPDKSSYEEGTTRGYYGDRIYMSTQVPLVTSDKTGVKNKYFIIRRTSNDDDIETLFE